MLEERLMPDATPTSPPPKTGAEPEYGHLPISEEMDRAKWQLPPFQIIAAGIVIVGVVALTLGWFARYKPAASGHIDQVFAVELADHASVLAAVQLTVRNETEKPIFI